MNFLFLITNDFGQKIREIEIDENRSKKKMLILVVKKYIFWQNEAILAKTKLRFGIIDSKYIS